MYTDTGLILATAEVPPNAGAIPSALGAASVTAAIDLAATHPVAGVVISDMLSDMELDVTVTESFVDAEPTTDADVTVTFEVVSMPILLSKLADATTSGKILSSSVTATATGDFINLVGHGLLPGTPIYIDTIEDIVGPTADTVYYVNALNMGADKFTVALTRQVAIDGGTVVSITTGTTSAASITFFPYIHASTGQIPFSALQAGARYVAKVNPYSIAGDSNNAWGSGTGQASSNKGWLPIPNRYLALRVVYTEDGSAGTDGRYTANLGVNMQSGHRHYPHAQPVL